MSFSFLLFFWIGSVSALIIAARTNHRLKKELRELKDELEDADRSISVLNQTIFKLSDACSERLQVINELKRKISNSTKGN